MNHNLLIKIGFSDKNAKTYLALLGLGPSSVRQLAEYTNLNRGSVYDALKWLQEEGLVSFYKKDTKQNFVAEDPEKLKEIIVKEKIRLEKADNKLGELIPELQALHNKGKERPVAKYFEKKEIAQILQDILDTCEFSDDKLYRIYSTEGLRESLYEDFPNFSDERIKRGIHVHAIAIGEGGKLRGYDKRKWLVADLDTPTYIIIYSGKTAYISLNAKKDPVGVLIENEGVYITQRTIFDSLWKTL